MNVSHEDNIETLSRSAPVVVFRASTTDLGGLDEILERQKAEWKDIRLDMSNSQGRDQFSDLRQYTGSTTLPQVFQGGRYLGGIQASTTHFSPPDATERQPIGMSMASASAFYLSLLPFLGLAAWMWTRSPEGTAPVLASYTAIILSFFTAVHWGYALTQLKAKRLYLWALIPVLIAWILASIPTYVGLPLLACALFGQWYAERRWFSEHLPGWYRNLRAQFATIASLMVIAGWIAVLVRT